jgi:hypothetical protein
MNDAHAHKGSDSNKVNYRDLLNTIQVPIGAVIPWVKSLTGVPQDLDNFVECSGQTLDDPNSPLDGQTIPDLNGSNYFLRGNSTSGGTGGEDAHTLTIAEMPAHSHNQQRYNGGSGASSYTEPNSSQDNTPSAGSPPTPTTATGSGDAHENKPPYYDVVWIIRIK